MVPFLEIGGAREYDGTVWAGTSERGPGMSAGVCQRLFRGVAARLRLAGAARAFHAFALALAAGYAALLLVSRLLGLVPDWLGPTALLAVPGLAAVLALAFHHRPTAREAARQALEELKQAFNAMKLQDKAGNLRRLAEAQRLLNDLWRRRSEERLKDASERAPDGQRLGAGAGQKAEAWKRQLQRGDLSPIKKELEEMQAKASRLAQASDPTERRRLAEELRQQLKGLGDFLADNASSKSLQDAVNRALEQLALGENKGLSKDAMAALAGSLQLAGM